MVARYEETNLILNWEKCHFIVNEEILFIHEVSKKPLEIDLVKVEVIEKLPPPISMKGVRNFIDHAGF